MFWAEIRKLSEFVSENIHYFSGKIFSIFEQGFFRNDFSFLRKKLYK